MTYHAIIERTYKDRLEFIRTFYKIRYKALNIFTTIFLIVIPVFIIATSIFLTVIDAWSTRLIINMIIMSLIWLYLLFRKQIYAWMMRRNEYKSSGGVNYEFAEDGINVNTDKVSENYKYSVFTEIYPRKGTFYLFIDKKHSFILPERCFTDCDGYTFAQFISQKCALEIINMK